MLIALRREYGRNLLIGLSGACLEVTAVTHPHKNRGAQKGSSVYNLSVWSVWQISGDPGDPSDHGHVPSSGRDGPQQPDSRAQKSRDTGRDACDRLEGGGTSSNG